MDGDEWAVRLRRGLAARLRGPGATESLSYWCALVALVAIAGSRSAGEVLICILLLVFATSVRAAAWCEYVEANERGIRWRALFRSTSVFWEDIARVEEVRIWRWGRRTQYRPIGLQVVLSDGRTRPLRASIWCGSKARQEWLAAGAAHLGSGRAVAFAPRPD